MSISTKVRIAGHAHWSAFSGCTIEQAAKQCVKYLCPHIRNGETVDVEWKRDDGTSGTLTATMRHEIEMRGLREPMT